MIIARDGDPVAVLSRDDLDHWSSLGGRIVRIGSAGRAPDILIDADGQLSRLMDEYRCNVIVKRPDFNIFGACPTVSELPALMADLRDQLQAGAPPGGAT